jgi:hypothetical protein
MKRFGQFSLITSFLALSWLGFMVVHEFGHVLTAWLTGGSVSRVVLHPLQISLTVLAHNPHPQLVAWGGPVFGSLLPLGLLGAARRLRLPGLYLFRFLAGFCLVANGLYLFGDTFEQGGDGGTLLSHGAAQWQLLLFGALTMPVGFWLWHGLGPHFGFGPTQGKVTRAAAITSASLLAVLVLLELAFYQQ